MANRHILLFLTDVNVPDSLGNMLSRAGHDVVRVRDVMAIDAPDPVIAEAAMRAGRILVSWDKDFNQQRFKKPRFASLSRIGFSCPAPEGRARLASVLDIVEFCFARPRPEALTIRIARNKIELTC